MFLDKILRNVLNIAMFLRFLTTALIFNSLICRCKDEIDHHLYFSFLRITVFLLLHKPMATGT